MGCKQCGTCCRWSGYVHVTEKDIKRIVSFLAMDELDFIDRYTCLTGNRQGLSLIEHDDGSCIFFEDSSNSCQIYDVRPQQCREFPLRWHLKDMTGCQFD